MSPFGSEAEGLPYWMAEWKTDSRSFMLNQSNVANQPFIVEMPNSEEYEEEFNIEGTVTFAAENTTVESTTGNRPSSENGFTLQGSYEGVTANTYIYALNDEEYTTDKDVTYLPGGVFVEGLRDVRPFEAYAQNKLLTRSRYLPIGQNGSTNGLPIMMLKGNSLVDVYTIQGILIRSQIAVDALKHELPAGIYIINNKKMIIK